MPVYKVFSLSLKAELLCIAKEEEQASCFWPIPVCSLRIAQARRSACMFAQGLASEAAPLLDYFT